MAYIVTATSGQVSTTKIQFPVKATVESVVNADSWSYDFDTDVLSVVKTHSSSETITVNFIKGGSGLDDFSVVRSTWMSIFPPEGGTALVQKAALEFLDNIDKHLSLHF